MEEISRVHPDCVNASNPYHECGLYCLEKIAKGHGRKEKKNLDNQSGLNGGLHSKKKDGEGKVHPSCNKASNPYHQCDEFCCKRSSEANSQGVKKETEKRNGIKQSEVSKKKNGERRVYPNCAKASNPYHECDENCFKRITEANTRGFKKESGSKILDVSRSFGKKKKGSDSQPMSPRVLDKTSFVSAVNPSGPRSPRSHFSRKNVELENGGSFSSSEKHSEKTYSRDQSFEKEGIPFSQPLPMSKILMPASKSPTKMEKAEKPEAAPPKARSARNVEENKEGTTSSNFSFLSVLGALHDDDNDSDEEEEEEEEEAQSVISDSCVSMGKYQVKANVSHILQSIVDKYGDIAANCQLESASMRAHYLECLCSVVQELQSTSLEQLTKSKVKEMFAVLKDVESAHIKVDWLRGRLNEISEAIELVSQHKSIESTKAECDRSLESARKKLESQMKDLDEKEKEVAEARARVAETKARLSELELEYSRLEESVVSMKSMVEKFQGKSVADDLL